MSDPYLQLYSQNWWVADGSQTIWNFTFENGYIDKAYVRAHTIDASGAKTEITLGDGNWTGPYQLTITPAVVAGLTLVIYRDTPKEHPLVNYTTGARLTAGNLDEANDQAIDLIQELLDATGNLDLSDLGFKALKHVPYTGASVVQPGDNGKAHYKTDGSTVTVPNTLPVEFLATIINDSMSVMNVGFDTAVGIMQGSTSTDGATSWALQPRNVLSITKVADGRFFISGFAS